MSDEKEKTKATASEGAGALEPFQRMREDMMSMADNFWRNAPGEALPWPWAPSGFMRWANPPIDMTETDESYTITVELAGLRKEDVNVEVDDQVLTVSGSKEDVHKEKRKHHQYAERRFGSFKRMVSLPRDADPEKIDASFGDGLLTVTLPKRPGSENARKVDIK
jgi:HSP20 family protein